MLHEFTSETMPGSFTACDLCNTVNPANQSKCFCQCTHDTCDERSAKGRSMCLTHDAERQAQIQGEREAAVAALPVVSIDPSVGMFYCSQHDHWATDPDEMRWADDGPADDCVIHPGIEGKADYPDLHDVIGESFYEQYEDGTDIEPATPIVEALDAAMSALERYAPTLYRPDMNVKVDMSRRPISATSE